MLTGYNRPNTGKGMVAGGSLSPLL
ncbi:uncharacterized protein METZ01_LOCUS183208, partial [marine metagenome]